MSERVNYLKIKDIVERQLAERVYQYSQDNCPVDTGKLKRSGRIVNGKTVVYSQPYAVYVHEIPGGRGFKFLERAVIKAQSELK